MAVSAPSSSSRRQHSVLRCRTAMCSAVLRSCASCAFTLKPPSTTSIETYLTLFPFAASCCGGREQHAGCEAHSARVRCVRLPTGRAARRRGLAARQAPCPPHQLAYSHLKAVIGAFSTRWPAQRETPEAGCWRVDGAHQWVVKSKQLAPLSHVRAPHESLRASLVVISDESKQVVLQKHTRAIKPS